MTKHIIVRNQERISTLEKQNAEMREILDGVPHNHYVPMPPGVCVASDCPRCRYERLKKEGKV